MGKTLSNQKGEALGNMTAIIGPSGNGKSTLADAFGFLADCLEFGVESACDTKNRGGFQQIRSQGVTEPIKFELYYREKNNTRPITYELEIDEDSITWEHINIYDYLWVKLSERDRGGVCQP